MDTKVVGGSSYWSPGLRHRARLHQNQGMERAVGEFFTDKDLTARSKVAVLGSTVAAKLFAGEDPIGKSLR